MLDLANQPLPLRVDHPRPLDFVGDQCLGGGRDEEPDINAQRREHGNSVGPVPRQTPRSLGPLARGLGGPTILDGSPAVVVVLARVEFKEERVHGRGKRPQRS